MSVLKPLSNLQQEILKLYSQDLNEEDLLSVKRLLSKYFADKAIKEADQIWTEKGYTQETMENWLNESKPGYGIEDSN